MVTNGLKLQVQKTKKMTWKIKDEYDNKDWVLPNLNELSSKDVEKAKKVAPEYIEKYFVKT